MQQQVKRYQPPAARWIPIRHDGKLLFMFDVSRGIVEIQIRNEKITVDLAAEVERHEQQSNAQIVS